MRFLGHPVHVMLIHFPVALWPAHLGLHITANQLPPEVSAIGGFWLLAAGTAVAWVAAAAGALDVLELARPPASPRLNAALVHASVNGAALIGFTVLAAMEYSRYPAIRHGAGFLSVEALLVTGLFAGNYFGGVARGDAPRAETAGGQSGPDQAVRP